MTNNVEMGVVGFSWPTFKFWGC